MRNDLSPPFSLFPVIPYEVRIESFYHLTLFLNRAPKEDSGKDEDGSVNPGSNLFVTGIHPRLTEAEVTRLFEKYGEVEKCQIMKDPHTKESRGFGFVKMVTSEQADAAKEGLQDEEIEGRSLSIEKARRARPRTPTPGKYFGPPKREHGRPRFDDRRRGGGYGGGYGGGHYGGGYGGRDDPYRYRGGGGGGHDRPRYDDRGDRGYREDRGYDRNYRDDRGGYGGGAGAGAGREERHDRGYERRERNDDSYGRVDRYGGPREDQEIAMTGLIEKVNELVTPLRLDMVKPPPETIPVSLTPNLPVILYDIGCGLPTTG
ncbi:hypothetical protein ONZ43_g4352 [Nemania bipapillata]|uniref:Uncharacterized protein n=1 Tax=Nemania bipapillata TaxID=110536 RepID=A0ACC2INM0_9PEZI|nr:hypothetical protein ONZ43_g4352 [Nemania bipapillata]